MINKISDFFSKRRRDKLEEAKLLVELDESKKRFLEACPNVIIREQNPLANYFYLAKFKKRFEIYFVEFGSFTFDRINNRLTELEKTSEIKMKADFLSFNCLVNAYKELERT